MKNQILVLVLFLSSIAVHAQDAGYRKAMGEAMVSFENAESAEDLNTSANTFARIAAISKEEYLPDYYAALSLIIESFYLEDGVMRDQLADQALEYIEAAEAISPNNVELEVLRGYALTAKMVVDPSTRGQKYSPMIAQHYGKAMQMNPENPRAMALMARNDLGFAQFFGSDPSAACAMAQKSIALFDQETPVDFEPSWGKDMAMEVAVACK